MKVILLMAITLDGKIARTSEHFPDWTGKADKKLFVELTKKAGVLIMGSKTFETIGAPLPKRKNVVMTRNTEKFHSATCGTKFQNSELEFTEKSPEEILKKLEIEGFTEVILAGGAQINTLFAKENLIDEIVLTISPLIFGEGISLFTEKLNLNLELLELTTLNENLVCVRYKVVGKT